MKKMLLLFGVMIIGILTLSAQKVSDKKARDILDKASAKIQALKTIKIEFTFTETDKDDKEGDTRKGRVWLKGNKYQLRFAGQIVYCDGKTKWTYITDAEEVHITNIKGDDDELANPTSLLRNYNRKFTARWIREEVYKGKKTDIVDLYPKKQNKGYHRVRFRIEQSTRQLVSTSVYHINNASQTIDVDKYVTNEPIADEQFTWDKKKHPQVEEIDLRK